MLAGELRATDGNIQINPKVRIARYTQVRVTHHTSHVTRHTSHVTRHTSHVTRRFSAPRGGAAARSDAAGGHAVQLPQQGRSPAFNTVFQF
jgi:hypothetical protein